MFRNTIESNFIDVLFPKYAIPIFGFVLRIFIAPGSTSVISFQSHLITWIYPRFPFGAFLGHTPCSTSVFDASIWL